MSLGEDPGGPPLELRRTEDPAGLSINGEIDLSNVDVLADAVRDHVPSSGLFTLDLSGCAYIGSEGIAVVIEAWKRLRDDGRLVLVAPEGTVRRVLELSGLERFPNLELIHAPSRT